MRKLILAIILLVGISCTASATVASDAFVTRDSLVRFAKQHIGTPYLWGGRTTKGFDCSGFVHYVFTHFGIEVSRTSRGYQNKGHEVALQSACPGDIILFTGTNPAQRTIGHVGIVLQNVNGTVDFIHSSSSKKHYGVTVTRFNDSGYVRRFLKIINILNN